MGRIIEVVVDLLKLKGSAIKAKRRVDFTAWVPAGRHAAAGQFWTILQRRIFEA